jgi:hypothetical protein
MSQLGVMSRKMIEAEGFFVERMKVNRDTVLAVDG